MFRSFKIEIPIKKASIQDCDYVRPFKDMAVVGGSGQIIEKNELYELRRELQDHIVISVGGEEYKLRKEQLDEDYQLLKK